MNCINKKRRSGAIGKKDWVKGICFRYLYLVFFSIRFLIPFKKDMDIYCTAEVEEALIREFPYVFSSYKYPGVPEIKVHNIKNEPFNINGKKFKLPSKDFEYASVIAL